MSDEQVQSDLHTTERLNFLRLSSILVEDGTVCIRQIFDKLVENLPEWLQRMKSKLAKSGIYKDAWKKLYPDNPADNPPSSANFDLTLLLKLLRNRLVDDSSATKMPKNQYENLRKSLNDLRVKRNGLYGHVTSCCIETELYDKEYAELHKLLVEQLPKYSGCTPPDIERWTRISLTDAMVASRQQEIRELTENDQSVMLALAEKLTKEIQNARTENNTIRSAIGKKLEGLCGDVQWLMVASRRGEDTENRLGASVGRLVDAIANVDGLQSSLFKVLSRLDDEEFIRGPLNDIRDQLTQHFDTSLAEHGREMKQSHGDHAAAVIGDLTKVIVENTGKVIDRVDQVDQKLVTLSDATVGKEAAEKERKRKEEADMVYNCLSQLEQHRDVLAASIAPRTTVEQMLNKFGSSKLDAVDLELRRQLEESVPPRQPLASAEKSARKLLDVVASNPRRLYALFSDSVVPTHARLLLYCDGLRWLLKTESRSEDTAKNQGQSITSSTDTGGKNGTTENSGRNKQSYGMIKNYKNIVETMNSRLVLDHTGSVRFFEQRDRSYIQSRDHLSSQLLLNAMKDKSVEQFEFFIEVLKETGQQEVASMFE
jgi:hypothetical protein